MKIEEYNIASNSINEVEAGLSNLSNDSFDLDGVIYASIEAFWQSLKFEKGSEKWNECIKLSGPESKIFGNKVENKNDFVYNGVKYLVGSKDHQDLMKYALKEQLKQNPNKLSLLLSTGNINLIHRPKKADGSYYPDSSTIPGENFSKFLMELRDEFNSSNYIQEDTFGKINQIL